MTSFLHRLQIAGCLLLLSTGPALATPPPVPTAVALRNWTARVEVLMVAVPQAMALKELPNLRDSKTIDAAVARIFGAIERKEALLTGYPAAQSMSGQSAQAESLIEKRYPTEFEAPPWPESAPDKLVPQVAPNPVSFSAVPTSFGTRNVGISMMSEPVVYAGGDWISMNLEVKNVRFHGWDSFEHARLADGRVCKIDQPRFSSNECHTTVTLQNGQRRLIAVHNMVESEGFMELFIVQAFATPAAPPPFQLFETGDKPPSSEKTAPSEKTEPPAQSPQ